MRIITDYSSFVHEALADVRRDLGDANLSLNRHDTTMRRDGRITSQVTLRVEDSRGILARRSHSGRRMVSACWHAHYLFMAALFAHDPNARITTAWADYHGAADFLDRATATGLRNIGSDAFPLYARAACDCYQLEEGGRLPFMIEAALKLKAALVPTTTCNCGCGATIPAIGACECGQPVGHA